MNSRRTWAALAAVAGIVTAAPASATLVSSRDALGGDDFLDWATVGNSFDTLAEPLEMLTTGGLTATVRGSGNGLVRDGFLGSLLPYRTVETLRCGFDAAGQPTNCGVPRISISFATGLKAFGAQIQDIGFDERFLGSISVFDLLGNLLETYTAAGFNSAPFLGVSRSTADIFRIDFGTNTGRDFAINSADLLRGLPEVPTDPVPPTQSVPEPSSLALFGLGLSGVLFARRRRSHLSFSTSSTSTTRKAPDSVANCRSRYACPCP